MADEVMALEERLARLEVTVATGFLETGTRIERLEEGLRGVEGGLRGVEGKLRSVEGELRNEIGSVESRLRVLIEACRDEQRTMAEAFGGTLDRIEARLEQTHRELLQAHGDHARVIQDHERRLTTLERRRKGSRSGG